MRAIKFTIAFLLLAGVVQKVNAEFNGWITEVYTKGGTSGNPLDWLEIYCAEDGDATGTKVYHMYTDTGTLVKTFPTLTVEKGDYIILHFSDGTTPDETTSTGDTNGNGYWDLYTSHENSSSWGISLSKGAFWITKSDGTWIDFVIFVDVDGEASWNNNLSNQYSTAALLSQWSPSPGGTWGDDDYKDNSADTSDRDTDISMQRTSEPSGDPSDTNRKDDWKMSPTSQGEGYFIPQPISGILKVENSPFFPYQDNTGQPTSGKILYELDSADYYVSLAIYDINGYAKRYLLRNRTITGAQGAMAWNGYDDAGEIVPVGIYIVHLKAEHRDTGRLKTAQATIVVGRKFK